MDADDDGFDDYREKIPGIEVFDPWLNSFKTEMPYITIADAKEMKTPLLTDALALYRQYKACGCLFNSKTINGEKSRIVQVITLFDEWANRMPTWEHENRKYL